MELLIFSDNPGLEFSYDWETRRADHLLLLNWLNGEYQYAVYPGPVRTHFKALCFETSFGDEALVRSPVREEFSPSVWHHC